MRRHVAPADPAASIPDPDRGGFLPAAGRAVDWTPHWAGMQARAEVVVREVEEDAPEPVAAEPEPEPEHEGGAVASVPFMITQAMRQRLRDRGSSDAAIGAMTPAEAHALLGDPPAP